MFELFKRLLREESGQSLVEYGLIIALIAVVAVAALSGLGTKLKAVFEDIAGKFPG